MYAECFKPLELYFSRVGDEAVTTLTGLERAVRNCRACELHATRRNAVFGEGPVPARLMIIGEAPGRTEDETGRPFVGRSGKLLSRLLEGAGIKREQVFITSVLKCFPPDGIKESYIDNCRPFLDEQLRQVKPSLVVLLGRTSVKAVLGLKNGMSSIHGRTFEKDGVNFFVTYHPSAVIRFPWKYGKIIERDFKKIGGEIFKQ